MIERNIGNIDRFIRLISGLVLAVLAFSQPVLNGVEWFIVAVSMALILNGVFQRCYLWYVLDINTAKSGETLTSTDPSCQL
jgi:hypothetical protein